MDRLLLLARCTDQPDGLTRLYLSPAHRRAAGQVRDWMDDAGMQAGLDSAGKVVGRYEAATPGAARPAARLAHRHGARRRPL